MSNIDEIAATLVHARQDAENARKNKELADKAASIAWAESASGQACKHAALQDMLMSAKEGIDRTRMSDRTFQLCEPADDATLKTMLSSSKHTVVVETMSWGSDKWLKLVNVEKIKPRGKKYRQKVPTVGPGLNQYVNIGKFFKD